MSEDFSDLEAPKNKKRISRWEAVGVEAIRADLEHGNGKRYVGRSAHHPLAWKWIRYKDDERNSGTYVFPVPPKTSSIRRLLNKIFNHQYTVAIVGGLIVAILGSVLLKAFNLN